MAARRIWNMGAANWMAFPGGDEPLVDSRELVPELEPPPPHSQY